MEQLAFFGSDVLNVKQASKLDMDAKGYRRVVLSAFDYDSRGNGAAFYKFTEQLKRLFDQSSTLMTRVKERNMYGEWGHPTMRPGERIQDFINRFQGVNEKHVSHHIRDIELVNAKDEYGRDVVLAMGWVKPFGPYATCLEQALSNEEQNCSFSIRSASKRHQRPGPDGMMRLEKEIYVIFGWDYVTLPGVDLCTKYKSPSKNMDFDSESFMDATIEDASMAELLEVGFTQSDLAKAEAVADHLASLCDAESHSGEHFTMIRTELGWQKTEVTKIHASDF